MVTPLRPLEFFYGQEFNLVPTHVFLRNISLRVNCYPNIQPYMRDRIRLMVDDVINPAKYFLSNISSRILTTPLKNSTKSQTTH